MLLLTVSTSEIVLSTDWYASSDHVREDIHKQTNVDEVSLDTDIGNIAHPDLITSGDLKIFKTINTGTQLRGGVFGYGITLMTLLAGRLYS